MYYKNNAFMKIITNTAIYIIRKRHIKRGAVGGPLSNNNNNKKKKKKKQKKKNKNKNKNNTKINKNNKT